MESRTLLERVIDFLEAEKTLGGSFSVSRVEGMLDDPHQPANVPNAEKAEPKVVSSTNKKRDKGMNSVEKQLEKCKSLDELKTLCEEVPELRTDLEGTRLVFGAGNPEADLMLVGEAPGAQEDIEGVPFVGRGGQLQNKILESIGLSREDVYIANILKHRPPDNRDPKPEERQRSLPYLMRQIELVNPKIVLCIGLVSASTLLQKKAPLKELRGTFFPFHGRELAVTYHPAALLRNPNFKRPTWEDMKRVRRRYDELNGEPAAKTSLPEN